MALLSMDLLTPALLPYTLWQAAMEEEAKEAAAVDPEAGAAITRLDELWGIMARDEE